MSNNAPDYAENLAFEPNKMQEYKHEYIHYEFDIRGEKFHLMDDEEYHGSILEGFNDGVNHAEKESEKMRDLQAQYACKLEEKLESTLSRAIQAENKLSREKMNKEACLSLLLKIDDWFVGMLETMNNECSEHNKSLPIGNFEQAFKYEHSTIEQLVKNIKE